MHSACYISLSFSYREIYSIKIIIIDYITHVIGELKVEFNEHVFHRDILIITKRCFIVYKTILYYLRKLFLFSADLNIKHINLHIKRKMYSSRVISFLYFISPWIWRLAKILHLRILGTGSRALTVPTRFSFARVSKLNRGAPIESVLPRVVSRARTIRPMSGQSRYAAGLPGGLV